MNIRVIQAKLIARCHWRRGTVPENDPLDETATLLLLLLANRSEVEGDDPELVDMA